jgi:hypothetical protein
MTTARIATLLVLTTFSLNSWADVKYIDDVMKHASNTDKKDRSKMINQIQTESYTDPKTGQAYQRVISVEKGSVFERAGVRKDDLLTHGSRKPANTGK